MLKELVDEKSFKSTFKKLFAKEDGIDDETAGVVVKKLDEEPVFDVVYKIAFGKMLSKIASGSAGGGAAGDRQGFRYFKILTLRFLDRSVGSKKKKYKHQIKTKVRDSKLGQCRFDATFEGFL